MDILLWLDSDREVADAERQGRDHRIWRAMPTRLANEPAQIVQYWWQYIGRESSGESANSCSSDTEDIEKSQGQHVGYLRTLINVSLIVFGLLSGMGICLAVFQYDGSHPINVVTVIAIFVILQVLLVSLSLCMLIPRRSGFSGLLANINPGAVLSNLFVHFMAGRSSTDVSFSIVGSIAGGHTQAQQKFLRWQLFSWSQLMGLAFNIGALAVGILLIIFTDLAFGWTSTLVFETKEFQALIRLVSMPWSAIWPEALPTDALIEQSRFFRLETDGVAENMARDLRAWWPFLVACILVYGLMPRLLLLLASQFLLRRATLSLLMEHPQIEALLERMRGAELALGAKGQEPQPAVMAEADYIKPDKPTGRVPVIIWAEAAPLDKWLNYLRDEYGIKAGVTFEAGGVRTLSEDRACVASLAASNSTAIIVVVKSWEPPVNDVLDFIKSLRQALNSSTDVLLMPVGPDLSKVEARALQIWRHALNRLACVDVYVTDSL
ncbi:MAG: DUF2868 domain-containing protein [Pseudomonadales bacterium]|nr:DUF2868 domain-containing protein [Pseudomonadales bacterium]